MKYITSVATWEPGAPVSVDLVHLNDGRVLGISSDCVVLYDSLADFEDCDTNEKPTISLVRSKKMKKYYGRVVMSYWQEFEVEADSEEQAQTLMLESFDISKADPGEGEVWDCEEIDVYASKDSLEGL